MHIYAGTNEYGRGCSDSIYVENKIFKVKNPLPYTQCLVGNKSMIDLHTNLVAMYIAILHDHG